MKRTKIFMDCEFTGLHQGTTLISIGMIAEDGRELYCELNDYDKTQIDDWLRDNVIANLHNTNPINTEQLRKAIENFIEPYETIEIWSDCLSYDWVLFNQIWGHAFNSPKTIYYIPFDLSSMLKIYGYDPDINRKEFSELSDEFNHNALSDARMIKACYEKILKIESEKVYYVYGYYDMNGDLFYIGKGKYNRKFYHLYESQNYRKDKTLYNKHKTNKIKSIISKIGIDEFIETKIKVIKDNLTEKEALDLEKTLILKYGKLIDNTGILTNITDGGEFCIGNHFKSREHRNKISKSLTGSKRAEKSRKKQSQTVTGINNPNYGKKHTKETKSKISKRVSKPIVFQGKKYKSITECAVANNVSRTTIMRWLKK